MHGLLGESGGRAWGRPAPSALVATLISAVLQACGIAPGATFPGGDSPRGFHLAFPYTAALTSQVPGTKEGSCQRLRRSVPVKHPRAGGTYRMGVGSPP